MEPTTATVTPTSQAREKTLGEQYVVHKKDRTKVGHMDFIDDILVISLASIDEDYLDGRREEIKKIASACEQWGVFQVVDNGICNELFTQMFELSR